MENFSTQKWNIFLQLVVLFQMKKKKKEKEIGCTGIILQTKEKGAFNNLKQGIKLTNR